jgi:hypothetical protein
MRTLNDSLLTCLLDWTLPGRGQKFRRAYNWPLQHLIDSKDQLSSFYAWTVTSWLSSALTLLDCFYRGLPAVDSKTST